MLLVNLLALLTLVIALVCWIKCGFSLRSGDDEEVWLFGAIASSAVFSAYSLMMGIAGVFDGVATIVSKLISLI